MLGRADKSWGGCYGSLFKKGREVRRGLKPASADRIGKKRDALPHGSLAA